MPPDNPHGALNERERQEAGRSHSEREEMPGSAFLEPEQRKYPVKTEQGGSWKYDRDLLLAAEREAEMHGHKDLAARAKSLLEREFTADEAPRAAGILYVRDGKVLLLKRSDNAADQPGTWGFPAGHIEEGESALLAALRESREEVGFAPEEAEPLSEEGAFSLFLVKGADFMPALSDESQGFVWASPDELPQPLHPGVEEAIQSVFQAAAQDFREYDTNGWFEVRDNPLSKVGVFPYSGRQIDPEGIFGCDPDRLYGVFRSAEALSDPDTLASCRLLPWIDNHIMLGKEEDGLMPAERKGVQGVLGEQIYFDPDAFEAGGMFGNIKVWSEAMATSIQSGKTELSLGYRCKYVKEAGSFNGRPYDFLQTAIRANHLALVESGRMGPEVAVQDAADSTAKEPTMAEETKQDGESKGGMTLEEAHEHLKTILPVIAKIQAMVDGAKPAEPAETTDAEEDDGDDKDKGKEGSGMDAAEIARKVQASIAERTRLYESLSAHVGAFDHAEMTVEQMAAYGCDKLGIRAPEADRMTYLRGYLAAKPAPSKTAAMDHAPKAGNFVQRFLSKV